MTIAERIQDSDFLAAHGRPIGALTMLMVAIAASSKKRFPKGTKSLDKPTKEMKDREAFTYFLGGRIADLLLWHRNRGYIGPSGISIEWLGERRDVAAIFYEFYRCSLIHEGTLPIEARLVPDSAPSDPRTYCLEIGLNNNEMRVNEGAMRLLREAVVDARCNGAEFGRRHFDFEDPAALTDAITQVARKFKTMPGRIKILAEALVLDPHFNYLDVDDATCSAKIISTGATRGVAFHALAVHGLADPESNSITEEGLAAFREIAKQMKVVEVFE